MRVQCRFTAESLSLAQTGALKNTFTTITFQKRIPFGNFRIRSLVINENITIQEIMQLSEFFTIEVFPDHFFITNT